MRLLLFTLLVLMYGHVESIAAAELSADNLQGKWMFTHILIDDGARKMDVNRVMEFLPDGSVVNYDAAGNEKGRASFKISGNRIIYTDNNDNQKWEVLSFESDDLHVDQNGAQMFFKRQ